LIFKAGPSLSSPDFTERTGKRWMGRRYSFGSILEAQFQSPQAKEIVGGSNTQSGDQAKVRGPGGDGANRPKEGYVPAETLGSEAKRRWDITKETSERRPDKRGKKKKNTDW